MRNLKEELMVTVLKDGAVTSATTTTGTGKNWGLALPRRVAACLRIVSGTAAHTLAVTIEGSNDGTNWSGTLASIAATDTAAASTQLVDLGQEQYARYRAKVTSAGAFSSVTIIYVLLLIGADPRDMPVTQVA